MKIFIFCISCLILSACFSIRTESYAERAQRFEQSGDYESAIIFYEKHFNARMEDEKRPSDENPYFYYILIGDNYLKLDDPTAAKKAFDTAKEHNVAVGFLVDRYKQLARYYRAKANYNQALEILHAYRSLDDLSFDYEIDSIHKEMVAKEEANEINGKGN